MTSRGHVGADITPKLPLDVFEVDHRTFYASASDAAAQLANTLRILATDTSLQGVIIARGGGDEVDLARLCTTEVQTAITSLRHASKTVVVAIGHGTFKSGLDADFEALTPADGGAALRAILVDHPRRRLTAIAEYQARLAQTPADERWPETAARELEALRLRLGELDNEHARALIPLRQ